MKHNEMTDMELVSHQINRVAQAITADVPGNTDAAGGRVESLTEAVMGLTAGMVKIAEAIERVADAMEDE